MRRFVVGSVPILAFGLVVALVGLPVSLGVGAAALLLAAMWLGLRCRHPHPSLLPAIEGADAERHQARWCCYDCGRTWPAHFEREHSPILKYAGFDEMKASQAQRRAHQLEVDRRHLALIRAGLAPPSNVTPVMLPRRQRERVAGDDRLWPQAAAAHAATRLRAAAPDRQR